MKRKNQLLGTLFMVLMALIMIPCYSQAASQKSKAIRAYNTFLTQKTHVWRDTTGSTFEDYQTQKQP